MKPKALGLPATATYPNRSAVWHRFTKSGFPLWGVLTVVEQTKSGRAKTSRYVVQELRKDKIGRRFRLQPPKQSDSEVSFVLLGAKFDECTCKGYTSHGKCKHTTTLRELSRRKLLPPPKEAAVKRGG